MCDNDRTLLRRTLPWLIRLGDFIGNGPIDPLRAGSLGTRCDLIGDIHAVLSEYTAVRDRLVSAAAEASERFGDDELEAYARQQRDQEG
jgi:hypothetical protein